MKKYQIDIFGDDPTMYKIYVQNSIKENNQADIDFWTEQINQSQDKIKFCNQWKGKELSLLEVENLIDELGSIYFDGQKIYLDV